MTARVLGAVLIGGKSRRMGAPKHQLPWRGRSLMSSVEAALSDYVAEIVLLGGHEGLADVPGHEGPIGGILAALAHAPDALWVVAACDMPLATPEAVGWLLSQWSDDLLAVLPVDASGREQPLLALYGPGCEALLEQATGPRALALSDNVATPPIPAGLLPCWRNANTPADLAALT